jgi:outer membrane receptor protein involved in Fe transport
MDAARAFALPPLIVLPQSIDGREMTMMQTKSWTAAVLAILLHALPMQAQESADGGAIQMRELTVRPEPGESRLPDSTISAIVLDADALDRANARHFQDLVTLVPDLTWAGGTSRPRYFQMRGVGEVSQFPGEGPPNFSIGFLVDDMDFSGLGMHASLFDVEEVEVLRGPQAAIYGSKALAGLVNIRTREPAPYHDLRLQTTLGTDGYTGLGVAGGGPLTVNPDRLQIRIAAEQTRMDGFRKNRYLGRDDTAQRDEFTGRLKLRWQPTDDWRIDLAGLYANLRNGYDHFTPDNDPVSTYSNRPGEDDQESVGGTLRLHWMGPEPFRILNILSYVETRAVYSYDADWGNDAFWAASPYRWDPAVEGYAYDFFEHLDRERRTLTEDLRLISEPGGEIFGGSTAWHVGGFFSLLREDDDFNGFRLLRSAYEATSEALYGQLTTRLAPRLLLYSSLRVEQRQTDYRDNDGVTLSKDDTMWGGRLALEAVLLEELTVFGAVSRGFKGSGVNQNPALPANRRSYDAETLWNLETGARASFLDNRLDTDLTLFYMIRDDLQIATSMQSDPSDPTAFVYFTDNAAQGYNRGVELGLTAHLTPWIDAFAQVSLLDTQYENFESAGGVNDIDGREQPFAPRYRYNTGLQVGGTDGFFARAEVEGSDAFYFAAGHNERAEPYELLHLKAGWRGEAWTLTFWGRNVLDKTYAVQGYAFGLEPPDYAETLYLTYGDPAQFGVTLDLAF